MIRGHRSAPRLLVFMALMCFAMLGRAASAQVVVDVTEGVFDPVPVAIVDFVGDSDSASQYGRDIAAVITANLGRSGIFAPIDAAAFIQSSADLPDNVRFADWRIINAQVLVAGRVQLLADGRLNVEFRLWDVVAESQLIGFAYAAEPESWRRIAHQISDAVYSRVTGDDGYFDTRIVYIAESGPANARVKRLAIMDQDGENHRYLTGGETLVLTPRFSPSTQEITYLSYLNNQPRVYLFNIDTGRQELLGDFPGMTFAPRFSPDGNRVIFSFAENGNSDLYVLDLRTRQRTRLTSDPGIDTGGSFSPDGSEIVFESDRGGSQQLYVMSASGANVRRISFGEGRYASPVWSPRGDLIAFTKIQGGRFFIGVMRTDGSGERLLAEGFNVEGPTWAPNGRVLMYFSTTPSGAGSVSRLFAVDLTTGQSWSVPTPIGGSDPAWSPLLP